MFKKWFDDIGKKIKGIAKFIFYFGVITSLVAGITMIAIGADMYRNGGIFIALGIIEIIVGPILAWLSVLLMYGFGELVDKTCSIERNICSNEENATEKSAKTKVAKCEICGKENIEVLECVIKDHLGTRYRKLCDDCRESSGARPI